MRLRLPMHGRDHRPGGADPIPGLGDGWRFNIDNEGGWGYVISNASTDIEFGILGMVLGDNTGEGFYIFTRDDADAETKRAAITLTPDDITLAFPTGISVVLNRAAGTFTFYDSATNPMLQVTDGSPDLHLPTGGNVVFDL